MSLAGKVIIITGASSGIGAGAAEHLSKLGAKLVLTGRNEENLKKTVEKCEGEVLALVSDVNSQSDREKVVTETINKFGQIDVLVNNAGIGQVGDILTLSMSDFDNVMNTNVRSVFHLTQLVAPHLIKTKGNIVNVSSVAGIRANPGFISYGMTKAALDQFTRCLALELAPQGVRVNSINPAMIKTEFRKRLGMDEARLQAYVERAGALHALGRIGSVEETSHAIAFLASDTNASFITGTILPVDGGKSLMCPR